MSGTEQPLVEVYGIGKTYLPSPPMMRVLLRSSIREPVVALQDVSFQVEAGKICAIVGPNGAGKSTLFRLFTGLTTPTTGTAKVCGYDVAKQSFNVRRLIGFHAADERMLLGRHSVRENLAFHGRLQGLPKRSLKPRVREVLELVGLERAASRLAMALSSGMKARLQLARALLHKPRVLILDEPTGSLDPVAAYQFLEVIKRTVAEQNIAALISSHRVEEIEALPDHVLLLDQGKLIYNGNLDSLRRHWEKPGVQIGFTNADAALAAAAVMSDVPGVEVVSTEAENLLVRSSLPPGQLFVAANGKLDFVVSISEVRMPLRDLLAKVLLSQNGQAK
jgi:ABC-2 type transport system ATP-binding protein